MKTILFLFLLLPISDGYKEQFQKGIDLYNKNLFDKAIISFKESYKSNKNSKTAYYVALSYFKSGSDSLANEFAMLSVSGQPKLSDNPYGDNLRTMIHQYELEKRFASIHLDITQSTDDRPVKDLEKMNPNVQTETQKLKEIQDLYYGTGPEGNTRMINDLFRIGSFSLPHEGEKIGDPIKDSL